VLIDAVAGLKDSRKPRCAIIGDGPLRGEVEKLAGELGISNNLILAGHRPDAPMLTEVFDVAVIASLMGHRSPAETGVYLHALPGRREDAVAKLDAQSEAVNKLGSGNGKGDK
jgi:glycosyltransferase involved in cell wall biosynthesis